MNNLIVVFTTIISILGGLIGGIITLMIKSIIDKNSHRSSKFFEYRAEALKDLYKKLYELTLKLESIIEPFYDEGLTLEMKLSSFKETYQEFYYLFHSNRILLPKSIKSHIESLIELIINFISSHTTHLAQLEDKVNNVQRIRETSAARKREVEKMKNEFLAIMEELEKSFAQLLGSED